MEAGNERRKGLWTEEEDRILREYVKVHGKGKWNRVAKVTDLKRCGKSCRLRWINYLNPGTKHGDFSEEEDDLIIRLHNLLGNRWSLIAGRVPGRTDNQVKNHWNTHLRKKLGIIIIKDYNNKSRTTKRSSSKPLPVKVKAENLSSTTVTSESNSEQQPKDDGINKSTCVLQDDGSKTRDDYCFSSPQEVITKMREEDYYYYDSSSPWLFGDHSGGLIPNSQPAVGLMEFVNEYPLDFLWHGL